MTTSEPPISEAELASLAGQLLAASFRPGPDTPPQTVPVAPRGNVPDLTAGTSAGTTAVGTADPLTPPAPLVPVGGGGIPAPTSPGPEFIAPQTVPVAPRGQAPGNPYLPAASRIRPSGVPPGLVSNTRRPRRQPPTATAAPGQRHPLASSAPR
jgi:cysteine desulfurase/selenocysteine lyase